MKYKSTNGSAALVDFRQAVLNGQAEDGGLYMPVEIPKIPEEVIKNVHDYSDHELAYYAVRPYVEGCIPDEELKKIIAETIAFETPLVQLSNKISVQELFHGPTMAFKDIGARFLSRCISYFSKKNQQPVTVLVATSGDTGSAVADGFYGVENVNVVILYPSGKVSAVQEKQLTTYGGNITALEVKGDFDSCQKLVKQAFSDEALRKKINLTSANSINIARWLPQQFYYFTAIKQWKGSSAPVISVPSGNFGNICAGILAWKAGLPVQHFIAACNVNNVVTKYLATGDYKPKSSVATIANAMDVGDPSNFVRILEIFSKDFPQLKSMLSSYSFTDEETRLGMKEIYSEYDYLSEPHGAIGYLALKTYLEQNPDNAGIFLETAHPVKFPGSIPVPVAIPERMKHIMEREKKAKIISPNYNEFIQELIKQ